MTYRMTVVLEYSSIEAAPPIGVNTKDFGDFKVYALQFGDALLELEVVEEYARRCDWDAAQADPRLTSERAQHPALTSSGSRP